MTPDLLVRLLSVVSDCDLRLADLCRDQMGFLQELFGDVYNAEEVSDLEKLVEADGSQEYLTTDFDPETFNAALEHKGRLDPDLLSASEPALYGMIMPLFTSI